MNKDVIIQLIWFKIFHSQKPYLELLLISFDIIKIFYQLILTLHDIQLCEYIITLKVDHVVHSLSVRVLK